LVGFLSLSCFVHGTVDRSRFGGDGLAERAAEQVMPVRLREGLPAPLAEGSHAAIPAIGPPLGNTKRRDQPAIGFPLGPKLITAGPLTAINPPLKTG
jgi:hypothetical protein